MKELYSWGANSHGQLALGYQNEQCIKPQLLNQSVIPFNLNDITTIKGGGGHTLILINQCKIYACGWNNCGQLGIGVPDDNVNEFKRIRTLKTTTTTTNDNLIKDIYCGWDTSAALTVNGLLYVWGSNVYGQLGVGDRKCYQPTHFQLPNNQKIKSISFGLRYTLMLTESSTLHLIGTNRKVTNALKLNPNWFSSKFSTHNVIWETTNKSWNGDVIHVDPIQHISCGQNHFYYITKNRILTGVGDNKFRQSECITMNCDIQMIKSGWSFNGLLTIDGKLYLWGRNTYGQLGIGNLTNENDKDNDNEILKKVSIECADDEKIQEFHLGSEHGHFMMTNRNDDTNIELWSWGWNEHGNCGNGSCENLFKPEKISLPGKCILACAGAGFGFALVDAS